MMKRFWMMVVPVMLVACEGAEISNKEELLSKRDQHYKNMGKFLGDEPLLFGAERKKKTGETGVGVNSYLWRAALDTISFMPLASVDPFGGVILTDWYSTPTRPDERLKVNVMILDRELRADGLKISVFQQKRVKGEWRDAPVSSSTAEDLEKAMLTRARQMRIQHK